MSGEAEGLLGEARGALDGSAAWGTAWQRAAALIGRQALEAAVRDVWTETGAAMGECSMSAQLTCLPYCVADPDTARRARQCWSALSSACHAHPYELAPTVAELRALLDEVDMFVRSVS